MNDFIIFLFHSKSTSIGQCEGGFIWGNLGPSNALRGAPAGEDDTEVFQMTHPSIDVFLPYSDHVISVIAILPKINILTKHSAYLELTFPTVQGKIICKYGGETKYSRAPKSERSDFRQRQNPIFFVSQT